MKKTVVIILMLTALCTTYAQGPRGRFNPDLFDAELEQYITREACLTPQEAARFFPIFKELAQKQRVLFNTMSRRRNVKPADEKGCREEIIKRDETEVQIKMLVQQYHNKYMEILPAAKVYDIIKAEDKFHREWFKKMAKNGNRKK